MKILLSSLNLVITKLWPLKSYVQVARRFYYILKVIKMSLLLIIFILFCINNKDTVGVCIKKSLVWYCIALIVSMKRKSISSLDGHLFQELSTLIYMVIPTKYM